MADNEHSELVKAIIELRVQTRVLEYKLERVKSDVYFKALIIYASMDLLAKIFELLRASVGS